MTQKQAAVTVTDASGVKDLVVPLGTTVTGLLSMLDIDSSDPSLQITGADGRPLNLGAVLGTDLPQGVLISITSGRERQRQEQRASERTPIVKGAHHGTPAMMVNSWAKRVQKIRTASIANASRAQMLRAREGRNQGSEARSIARCS